MKVIDLLNKIANREELPEKIKYDNEIYYLADFKNDGKSYNYYNEKTGYSFSFEYRIIDILNKEVELLEDEEIDIQEIEELCNRSNEYFNMLSEEAKICWLNKYQQENKEKINEIIRVVNKIQKSTHEK